MILDTSAIAAVLLRQAESAALHRMLSMHSPSLAGAPTLAEAGIVLLARLEQMGLAAPRILIVECDVHSVPFGEEHWRRAAQAFATCGQGRHPAGLTFGDVSRLPPPSSPAGRCSAWGTTSPRRIWSWSRSRPGSCYPRPHG